MFKKGPDIDKKKLLSKASDVKKDSLTRLKHFRTLIDHLDFNEVQILFKSHFSFIYHTFIDTFSTFDCTSKQRREDLECLLYMLEKILINNPDLIRKRWQFYSITFVMQKILHQSNTWQLRQEGIRLFILWYQILCDEQNIELQIIFATLVPDIVPKTSLPNMNTIPDSPSNTMIPTYQQYMNNQPELVQQGPIHSAQLPIKLCNIDPLVPAAPNEQIPLNGGDESSFYLDCLLQYMITQTTKPLWASQEEVKRNQESSFAFIFNMFKKVYLEHLFINFSAMLDFSSITKSIHHSNLNRYIENQPDERYAQSDMIGQVGIGRRENLNIDLRQASYHVAPPISMSPRERTSLEHDRILLLSNYQAIVIRWLTRILRQDMILNQDDLTFRAGSSNSVERNNRDVKSPEAHQRETSVSQNDSTSNLNMSDTNQHSALSGIENTSREMDIARRVIGTRSENITVVHELFRRAFLNFNQPASMKRVVNVYKEWICNGIPSSSQPGQIVSKPARLGYATFGDLLQVFVLSSSNAFLTQVQNQSMLDEQVEMCKRIMNIYRYMVMKIYMNTQTWEQLLNVMLQITEHLFPTNPPERKELTIGGRIAPAFFQTFIVSWIRANLYVHISDEMWRKFHGVMKDLIRWRELIEEWSTTMGSLTRVLVKHVYGLNLTDLPLDRPQDRRRRPRGLKSFSTAESIQPGGTAAVAKGVNQSTESYVRKDQDSPGQRGHRSSSMRLQASTSTGAYRDLSRALTRSNSDGLIECRESRLYFSSATLNGPIIERLVRKIRSEYLILETQSDELSERRYETPLVHTDAIDGTSLKDPSLIYDHDQPLDSHQSGKSGHSGRSDNMDSSSNQGSRHGNVRQHQEKCVLLGGTLRGWTDENSVIMWRRMLGLFGNINRIEDADSHLVAIKCLAIILCDFMKTRDNLGISLDNINTPAQPELIPPYTYPVAWLLEATQLPPKYNESRLAAYKLLCIMSIRRHDVALPDHYYTAFYEAIQRGLTSHDTIVQASVIRHIARILSMELPGCTILVQSLFECSRSILLNHASNTNTESKSTVQQNFNSMPRDQAIQILASILALHKPLRKLMVLKTDHSNPCTLVAPKDLKSKIFETLTNCFSLPNALDNRTKSTSLSCFCLHVYQDLLEKGESPEVEQLVDLLLISLQDSNNQILSRLAYDLLRLLSDHANILASSQPTLVSSIVQVICQQLIGIGDTGGYKQNVYSLLLCLEDWCMSVSKSYLLSPLERRSTKQHQDATMLRGGGDSLLTWILKSLAYVINNEQSGETKPSDSEQSQWIEANKSIKLACKISHLKLVTYLGHFPFRHIGPASMSCCVNEFDYLTSASSSEQEITQDFVGCSNILLFALDNSTIISFIGDNGCETEAKQPEPVHVIVRNLCGKYAWDASVIELDSLNNNLQYAGDSEASKDSITFESDSFQENTPGSMKYDSDYNDDCNMSSSLSSRSSSNRDCIGDLLNCLNSSLGSVNGNQSLLSHQQRRKNSIQSVSNSKLKIAQAEETMIALLTNQRFQELNFNEKCDDPDRVVLKIRGPNGVALDQKASSANELSQMNAVSLEQCRQIIQQLGYLSWDKRLKIESLAKNQRLLRELKNLDAQPTRETHKIAVIYVANGQEDKTSILTNSAGSRAFEDFVSGLGWEVNLASHLGFKGGLQSNRSAGETSAYYCNATTEVMFHVSTRIPVQGPADDESLNRKLRHIGNDEIHIVWSEHSRDYRRGIIPTEFGDVLIVVYPMLTFQGYYRIQILCKDNDIPIFGPLFDNCIVHQVSLAPLVRATAINASRAKRLNMAHYQCHFEERNRLIESIVQNHKEKLSFEEFAAQLYNMPTKSA